MQPHLWVLAEACESMFDVRYYRNSKFIRTPGARWQCAREKRIVFIGLAANVETAIVTFAYLRGAVDAILKARLREGAIEGVSEARDYKLGAAMRIRQAVAAEKRRATASSSEMMALVRVSSEIAQKAIDALNLKGSFSVDTGFGHVGAFDLGQKDGAQINPYSARTNRMLAD